MARVLEYAIITLLALIVGFGIGYLLFWPGKDDCTNCGGASRPQVRADCEKQFSGIGVRAKQLEANAEDEYLVAFIDQRAIDPNANGYSTSSSGYSTPSSYPGVSPAGPREPGYVMVRAQPQFGYDYSGGQTSSYDPANTRPGTTWQEVTVTVVRYVSPQYNDSVCSKSSVRYVDGRFETYCDIPTRFQPEDGGQASYRIFVRNESSVPVEYCIVSNCDASAPYGGGSLCQAEQLTQLQ